MATITCPKCMNQKTELVTHFSGTIQCSTCGVVLRVVVKDGITADVRLRSIDLDIPPGLPTEIERLLSDSIACAEIEVSTAAVVLAGLFLEGLLQKAGMSRSRLVDMITQAHKAGVISDLGLHLATASRYLRNIGAHFSDDLAKLSPSDARLVLEIVRKLAADVVESGRLKGAT